MPEGEVNVNAAAGSSGGSPSIDPVVNGSGGGGLDLAPNAVVDGPPDWPTQRGWIRDEKLRVAAERFNSVDDIVKSNGELRGMLSNRHPLPGPNSSPEDVAQFRKAFGVPSDAAGYEFKPPENVKMDDADMAVINMWKPILHENNIPAAAFQKVMAKGLELSAELRANIEKQFQAAHQASEGELRKEWGTEFDKNLALAQRAASAHGADRFKNFLEGAVLENGGKLGDHPEMVRFLANLGRKTDESSMFLQSDATERESAREKLEKLFIDHPVGTPSYMRDDVQRQVAELNRIIYGDAPIVGVALKGN